MMYMIVMNLSKNPSAYASLFDRIRAMGPYSERLSVLPAESANPIPWASTWMVYSQASSKRIRATVTAEGLVDGDRILVVQMTTNWAAAGMGPDFATWMSRRAFSLEETDGEAAHAVLTG